MTARLPSAITAALAPALVEGQVMHRRKRPAENAFTYPAFCLRLPLSRLEELPALGIARNRRGVLSFDDRDHGARDGSPLLPWIRAVLAREGIDAPGEVVLHAFPRMLGYVFNPVSFWFCHRADGALRALVYEVNNTFGERHSYVIPAMVDGLRVRQTCRKAFYVSPFLPMDCTYHFRVGIPGERLSLAIHETHEGTPILDAWVTGERRPLTDAALLRAAFSIPLLTLKVLAGIHWEALKLWLKGAPLFRHDPTPVPGVTLVTPEHLTPERP